MSDLIKKFSVIALAAVLASCGGGSGSNPGSSSNGTPQPPVAGARTWSSPQLVGQVTDLSPDYATSIERLDAGDADAIRLSWSAAVPVCSDCDTPPPLNRPARWGIFSQQAGAWAAWPGAVPGLEPTYHPTWVSGPAGSLFALFDIYATGGQGLQTATFNHGVWSAATQLSGILPTLGSSMGISPNGRRAVKTLALTDGRVAVSRLDPAQGWLPLENIAIPPGVTTFYGNSQAAVADDGRILLFWQAAMGGQLKYLFSTWREGSGWSPMDTVPGVGDWFIKTGLDGKVYMAGKSCVLDECDYVVRPYSFDAGWGPAVVPAERDGTTVPRGSMVHAGPGGHLMVMWEMGLYPSQVAWSRMWHPGSGWDEAVLMPQGLRAFDTEGSRGMARIDADGTVTVATRNNGVWRVDRAGWTFVAPAHPSSSAFAIDAAGRVTVAWVEKALDAVRFYTARLD